MHVATAPIRMTTSAVGSVLQTGRPVHQYGQRLHIPLYTVHLPGAEEQAEALVSAAEGHPAVVWARVNSALGRLIVLVDGEPPTEALLKLVDSLDERASRPGLPLAIGTDVLGLALTGVERVIGWAPLPAEAAGVLGFVTSNPKLRKVLPATRWLPIAQAAVQTLSPGGTGLTLDLTQRVWQWRESSTLDGLWRENEERLTGTPEAAACDPIPVSRPCGLPPGPVENHQDQSLPLGMAGATVGAALTGDVRRALETALAAAPKAGELAREMFASELTVRLAHRGVLTLHPTALRRLDRINTVVLDADALSGDPSIGEVVVVDDTPESEIATQAYVLFDPTGLDTAQEGDGWSLGPLPSDWDPSSLDEAIRTKVEPLLQAGEHDRVLGLQKEGRVRAVLSVVRQAAEDVDGLVAAARKAGVRLVTAGELGVRGAGRIDTALAEGVCTLQQEQAGILLVSRDGAALAAADVGLGIVHGDEPAPWGADLLVRDEIGVVALVIEAVAGAQRVGELSVTLSRSGSGVGALLALTSPRQRAAARGLAAVNGAAGVAMAHGVWRARDVMRQPIAPPKPSIPWHAMPVETVLEQLGSSESGLSEQEAEQRASGGARHDGVRWPLVRAVGKELANPLTAVLAAGAAGSAAVGSLADAALVAGAMGISGLVGGVQRRATDQTIEQISHRSTEPVRVLREGNEESVENLVRGDIVVLSAGDAVPADCRVIEADGLEADESSLTGESLPVAKNTKPTLASHVAERSCMLYEGTTVAAGEAKAVVVATGEATESGRAMAASYGTTTSTGGVEARLKQITDATTPMAIGAALAVTTSGLVRGRDLRLALSEGVNLAVASVPEGLPLLVSAAQLAATRRLAARGIYVRNPRTIETLGRVDVLCFDKTGTLTEGELKLARVADHEHTAALPELDDKLRDVLTAGLRATPIPENGDHSHLTDAAVDDGAEQARIERHWEQTATLPFEPSRAYHAALGRSGDRTLICVKGAPETVLPRCVATPEGRLDDAGRRRLEEQVESLAAAGHRVLAVAERSVKAEHKRLRDDSVKDLTFLGVLGLADVVRDTAAPAVAQLREAGVHIVMLTGDHPTTAGAIAADVTDGKADGVITADEIDHLDDEALGKALEGVDVVARCTPVHKVRILQAYRSLDKTVAMTGDGANDAAAIRLADVGIALGGRGTAAAQAAADLVVADDQLETIVSALVEGRAMWGSVREALAILVGGNLGEIGFTLLGSLAAGRSPLSARQMLLMNMLTDLAPALAIAVRKQSEDDTAALLKEGPESSLGTALTQGIAQRAVVTTIGASLGWTAARFTGPAARARTVGLVALIGTQLAQTLTTGRHDRAVLVSALGSALLLAAIVQTPFIGGFFGCVPLDPIAWGLALAAIGAATATSYFLPGGPRQS
jgi:cation-transporting P-type ATPase I